MRWFNGDVGLAIAEAKAQKTLFVVFVVGAEGDEKSATLMQTLESSDVSSKYDNFVNIKLVQGSTTCTQFSQLYPVILAPSVYYIDSQSGMDVEVTACPQESKDLLSGLARAQDKLQQMNGSAPSVPSEVPNSAASGSSIAASSSQQQSETTEPEKAQLSLAEREKRVRELIQKKKEEKMAAEKEKEKDHERDRRALGKNLQEFKRQQEEEKMKEAAAERRKDREEAKLARERVKAAIEEDRAERAAKFNAEKRAQEEKRKEKERQQLAAQAADAEKLAAERSSVARIQFRLPDGRSQTKHFPADSTLETVYQFVDAELNTGFSAFSLSTAFPRRNLDSEPKTSTLRELQLAPSSTVLVLPVTSSVSLPGGAGSIESLLWLILTPFTFLWGLIMGFIGGSPSAATPAGGRGSGERGSSSAPTPGPSSMRGDNKQQPSGRMRTMNDLRDQDGDDENNTYNGNMTQQQ